MSSLAPCDEEEDLSSHDSGQDYEQSSTIIPPSTADDVTPTATLQTCENAPKTTINLLSGGNNSEEDVSSVDEGIDVGACSSTSSHSTHKNFHQIKRQTQCSPASWNTESDSPPVRVGLMKWFVNCLNGYRMVLIFTSCFQLWFILVAQPVATITLTSNLLKMDYGIVSMIK